MTTPQKLLVTVLFLGAVALAVGGEDRPGLLTMAQQTAADGAARQAGDDTPVPAIGVNSRPVGDEQVDKDGGSLDDWYAEVTPMGPGTEIMPISESDDGGNSTSSAGSANQSDGPQLSPADIERLQAQIRN